MAGRKKKAPRRPPRDSRGRWVKAYCRRKPESRLAKRNRVNKSMPF